MLAEIFMSLDDIDLISYQTSKIMGGTVFGIEKLLSYASYLLIIEPLMILLALFVYAGLYYAYPDTEHTNILYLIVVFNWMIGVLILGSVIQIIGALIYTITDFDVAIYDCGIFKRFLLPAYYIGLLLIAIG
jgi:hypothetical protein